MIYGIVPVGGKGTRLGLPFSKELLPIKGYDYYYPVCKYTVDNMLDAGCDKVYFIHGKEFKKEILEMFYADNYYHIKNLSDRQSDVFGCFFKKILPKKDDIYLYGLPDSYYEDNIFIDIKDIDGLALGMFEVDDDSKVGRLDSDNRFIKSVKMENTDNRCWGLLKMNFEVLSKLSFMLEENIDAELEIESFLNEFNFTTINGGNYWDLGTWKIINKYWENKNKNIY